MKRDWGRWRYNGRNQILYMNDRRRGDVYEMGMWEVETQKAAEDWYRQLAAKSWTTPGDLEGLWAALLDLAPAFKAYRQERRRAKAAAKSLNTER